MKRLGEHSGHRPLGFLSRSEFLKQHTIMPGRVLLRWTVLAVIGTSALHSQTRLSFVCGTTVPVNIPMPLAIHQRGEPDIQMTARYASEPFAVPICWIWRIGYWSGRSAWELEAIHQKLVLENTTPEVESFGISHGWNLVTINRAWDLKKFEFRFGCGVVLTHPESVIRGKQFDEAGGIFGLGYFVSGPVVTVGVGTTVTLWGNIFVAVEGKAAFSCARVYVAEGHALAHNIAAILSVAAGADVNMGD